MSHADLQNLQNLMHQAPTAMLFFDCDFLHDDIEKVAQTNVVATIVDGEEVYRS